MSNQMKAERVEFIAYLSLKAGLVVKEVGRLDLVDIDSASQETAPEGRVRDDVDTSKDIYFFSSSNWRVEAFRLPKLFRGGDY